MPPRKNAAADDVSEPEQASNPAPAAVGGEDIEDEVRKAATEYFDRLNEAAGRLTNQARQVYSLSQDYARDHPTGLVAGAFGLGVLLGMLLDSD